MHPKIIACRSMLEKLKKERSEHLIDEFRLKLPFVVENRYVHESENPDINVINIYCYPDGSKHMHLELLDRQQGSFSLTSADDMSVKSTAEIPVYSPPTVPGSVSIGHFASSPYQSSRRSSSRRQSYSNSTICSNLSTLSRVYASYSSCKQNSIRQRQRRQQRQSRSQQRRRCKHVGQLKRPSLIL